MLRKCTYCEKKEGTELCPYCKKYYCSEHINPIEPGSYHPEKSRVFLNQIRLGHETSHPCPDYVDYLEEQKKIQNARYGKALDRLTGRIHRGDLEDEDDDIVFQDNKKNEKHEPYLYRYIPPEEKSKTPPKVQETYRREQVVFEREGYVTSLFNKFKKYLRRILK